MKSLNKLTSLQLVRNMHRIELRNHLQNFVDGKIETPIMAHFMKNENKWEESEDNLSIYLNKN